MWPSWTARWRSSAGSFSSSARQAAPPGSASTPFCDRPRTCRGRSPRSRARACSNTRCDAKRLALVAAPFRTPAPRTSAKPGCGRLTHISPSPTRARPRAPSARSPRPGSACAIGRSAPKPSGCRSFTFAPSTTHRLAARAGRAARARSARASRARAASCRAPRRPVKPVPIATASRPGAFASSVAIAAAVVTHVAQARHEHRRTEADLVGVLRDLARARSRRPRTAPASRTPTRARSRATRRARRSRPDRGPGETQRRRPCDRILS